MIESMGEQDQVELSQNRMYGGSDKPVLRAACEGLQALSTTSESGGNKRESKATAFEHKATSSQYAQCSSTHDRQ